MHEQYLSGLKARLKFYNGLSFKVWNLIYRCEDGCMDMYLDSFDLSESTNLNRHKLHNTSLWSSSLKNFTLKKKKKVLYMYAFSDTLVGCIALGSKVLWLRKSKEQVRISK